MKSYIDFINEQAQKRKSVLEPVEGPKTYTDFINQTSRSDEDQKDENARDDEPAAGEAGERRE